MIRTQLYLPEDQHQTLLSTAEKKGVSMAELARNYIKKGLQSAQSDGDNSKKTMQAIAKLNISGAPADLSTRLDSYLYQEEL